MLRERREAIGISLAEVEAATRIRQKYLSALESDDWHLLPGEVVGRGFLRNYAEYLGLDGNEVLELRRQAVDVSLAAALANTSAGTSLPPERQVDYRPKEVDLKDEPDGIPRSEIRLGPFLVGLALVALVFLGWWGISRLSGPIGALWTGARERTAQVLSGPEATPTTVVAGVVNAQNITPPGGGQGEGAGGDAGSQAGGLGGTAPVLVPTDTPTPTAPAAPVVQDAPADTPTPVPPTPTFTPVPPTPTFTPEPALPTDTPTPEPLPVVAPACPDPRAVITAPGVNQVVNGVIGVMGTAVHEQFQYYKLEYAEGANAAGGFIYFAGANGPVNGGLLGSLDTRALPNGAYTIQLTVVDQTGNFPPPCQVSVVIQN